MGLKKLLDKILKHIKDIIFGILSGSGLMFIVTAIIISITLVIPSLETYFIIMYVALYLLILIPTAVYYAKGWFRIIYLTSALILLFKYIYTNIF